MKHLLFLAVVCTISIAVDAAVARADEEEPKPQRPTFPLFNLPSLPSLPSLSLPALSLPTLPQFSALNIPNPFPPVEIIRATKTEYVEVTRRQTVHPVCFTAYEAKAPCLPHRYHDESNGHIEVNTVNHINDVIDITDEEVNQIQPTAALQTPLATAGVDESRSAKYLEFRDRNQQKEVEKDEVEGSESTTPSNSIRNPFQRQSTEYVTKTVLVTKLEKITDHRVTATVVAQNCLPVDPNIPRCRRFNNNPIFEGPLHQTDVLQAEDTKQSPIIIASVVHPKPNKDQNQQVLQAVEAVNQISSSIQQQSGHRRPTRPYLLPTSISGSLGIHLEDDVEQNTDESLKEEEAPTPAPSEVADTEAEEKETE